MKNKKNILIISAIVIGLVLFYFNNKNKKINEEFTETEPETETIENKIDTTIILSKGSQGEEVKRLQKAIGFTGADIDGIFGSLTEKRLKKITGKTSTTIREYNLFVVNNKKKITELKNN